MRPEEVGIEALIDLPLLVNAEWEWSFHDLWHHAERRIAVLEKWIGLLKGTFRGGTEWAKDQRVIVTEEMGVRGQGVKRGLEPEVSQVCFHSQLVIFQEVAH